MSKLTIALPTGRLGKDTKSILFEKGILSEVVESRKLQWDDPSTGFKYIYVKPTDVGTYVEKGVADIGVVGRDSILEQKKNIFEILDLNIGKCEMVIAGLPKTVIYGKEESLVVATKYPNIAKEYFDKKSQKVEILKLNGSIEIAPLVNLSDVIVDITQTGTTLRENGLVILDTITDVSARVIANQTSYRFKDQTISELISKLKE